MKNQLKNLINALWYAVAANHTALFRVLMVKLASYIQKNKNLLLKVSFAGLLSGIVNNANAQDIVLEAPILLDSSQNLFGLSSYMDVEFIDIDHDGDVDALFTYSSGGCGCNGNASYCDFSTSVGIKYNNNDTNNDSTWLSDGIYSVEIIFSKDVNYIWFVSQNGVRLADFDKDGDWDLYISNIAENGLQIYENYSGIDTVFDFSTDSIFIVGSFKKFSWDDIDLDGDLDLRPGEYIDSNSTIHYYENLGGNNLIPFDTLVQSLQLNLNIGENLPFILSPYQFIDMDNDGTTDVLLRAFYGEIYSGSYTSELIYFKNNSDQTFDFDPDGQLLFSKDVLSYSGELGGFAFSSYVAGDVDNDNDKDIFEIGYHYIGDPCSSVDDSIISPYLEPGKFYLHENITNEVNASAEHWVAMPHKLFPNPANSMAYWQFENEYQNKAILKIYDIHGRLLFMDETYNNSFQLDNDQLANGLYTYVITIDKQIGFGKLVLTD
ncbi:MAG: T9SS type A sorting domain-containing protein [Chitinophagales bacterium]